jgi:hypothetical protein
MMLYTFVKKDGLVQRVGGESPVSEELQAVFLPWTEKGYVLAEASEWDQQEMGALEAQIKALTPVPVAPSPEPVPSTEA